MQLSHQGTTDTASLPARVDVDSMEFRFRAFGVVVQVADHVAVSFSDQKFGVISGREAGGNS